MKGKGKAALGLGALRKHPSWNLFAFNLMMMFLAWSAMSFGVNLLTFYTKHLPGDVYSNSMVIGFASLAYVLAGPLGLRAETR